MISLPSVYQMLRRSGWVGVACISGWVSAATTALGPADFVKVDGTVLRADSGTGAIVDLRGTNIGGWLVQEGWMSPNGHGAVDQKGWSVTESEWAVVFDGDSETSRDLVQAGESSEVVIDLGVLISFDRLVISTATPESVGRGLLIELSASGSEWVLAPVRSVQVEASEVVWAFRDVHTTRFVRLRSSGAQTAAVSVAEVQLLQNDDYTVRMALARRFGAEKAERLLAGYHRDWFKESDIDNLQTWGMNLLRVPMNWMQFVDAEGNWKPNAFDRLDWAVEACGKRGMYVMLDMHAVPGGASPWASSGRAGEDGTGQNPNGFWTNPEYLELTAKIWTRIAEHYRGNPVVVAYDLVNEPLYRFDENPKTGETYSEPALKKAAMYDRIYRAVRAVDPDHIIVIAAYTVAPPDNTAYIGTPSGFIGIPPPSYHGWTNVIYQTHHYDMTHPRDWQAQNRLVETALADIAHHQREWNVPVFAGEYSLYGFQDVWAKWMAGMNDLHVSWTNWTYKVRGVASEPGGGDWGFFNTNPSRIPNMEKDSAEEIAAQWQKFSTNHFQRNDRLIATVSRFAKGQPLESRQLLSRDAWVVKTSKTGTDAFRIIDSDVDSGWTSDGTRDVDDWVQIDLGAKVVFDGVVLETLLSQKEAYPAHYEIEVSADGQSWSDVISGRGFGDRMAISFPRQQARYVKIARPAAARPSPWSLAELNLWKTAAQVFLKTENDDRSGKEF
jgi:aryl-phospho-beta-D-glucosidase BglC (GH1 family)